VGELHLAIEYPPVQLSGPFPIFVARLGGPLTEEKQTSAGCVGDV